MRALAILCVLLVTGCHSAKLSELAISPDFEPYQQEAIIEAAEAWFERVPEMRVPVYVGEDRGLGAVVPSAACSGVVGLEDEHSGSVRIVICPAMRDPTFAAAKHEIGHALAGRPGHLEEGNVMEPVVENYRRDITERDVDFVLGLIPADQK